MQKLFLVVYKLCAYQDEGYGYSNILIFIALQESPNMMTKMTILTMVCILFPLPGKCLFFFCVCLSIINTFILRSFILKISKINFDTSYAIARCPNVDTVFNLFLTL